MRARFLSLPRSARVRSAVALAAASMPFAYEAREQLRESGESCAAVSDPIADKQRVEKRWVLESARSDGAAHRIRTVKISAPGLTFVSAEPSSSSNVSEDSVLPMQQQQQQQLGAVRVSADRPELLECIEVVPLQPNGVEIRFKQNAPAVTGHLLTELTLARGGADVNVVDASGGGVVVVEPNVLVADCAHAELALSLRGHGELFVAAPATAVNVRRLVLRVTGNGRLQLDAAAVTAADDVLLQVAGAGHAQLFAHAHLRASTLKSSIAGAGHTLTVARELTANKLKSSIAGYGDVTHLGAGRAATQRVAITGSGSVATPQVASDRATVRLLGSGDATLDVRESLDATCRGWGVVRYVHSPPQSVTASSGLSLERARAAVRNPAPSATVSAAPVPTRCAAFDDIAVVFDPTVAADERRHRVDVFGAISAVKRALSDRHGGGGGNRDDGACDCADDRSQQPPADAAL